MMNKKILYAISTLLVGTLFTSCKNGDADFPDYQGGTTAYFAYQYPIRTIVLGDDEYDLTLDHAHKCKILATFGGKYGGINASLQVAVDPTLVDHLTFEDGTPVKAMPTNYYTLETTTFDFKGGMNGGTEVQLTDAFFADPDAVKNTYVIPLSIVDYKGFDHVLTGTPWVEGANGARTDASLWRILPKDYVLYCVKFQNKYSGFWLSHHTSSTDNIEKAQTYEFKSLSLNSCSYAFSYTYEYNDGDEKKKKTYSADLLLTFDGNENCTVSSLTPGVTVAGTGSWTDDGAKKSWGNKDRDLMELNYNITFDDGYTLTISEKLVWQRSGVTIGEFAPTYNN